MATMIRPTDSAAEPAALQLPQNIEAEAALLGAMMIDNRLADDVLDRIEPEHFFEPLHGRISVRSDRCARTTCWRPR